LTDVSDGVQFFTIKYKKRIINYAKVQ
jgi:hypothetical protein